MSILPQSIILSQILPVTLLRTGSRDWSRILLAPALSLLPCQEILKEHLLFGRVRGRHGATGYAVGATPGVRCRGLRHCRKFFRSQRVAVPTGHVRPQV